MWYFFHVSEDNKSVLRYTVSNCPVRSRSYITLIMTGRLLHGHFKKCCKVCSVGEIVDLLYFLECSRLCYFEYVLIKAPSLLLSAEAGPYLTEKEGNVMRPSASESMCAIRMCPVHVRNIPACGKIRISLSQIFLLPSFTFFDSKTHWLFPSSSIWFHQRRPTNNLPDTFWGKIKDWKQLKLFLIIYRYLIYKKKKNN